MQILPRRLRFMSNLSRNPGTNTSIPKTAGPGIRGPGRSKNAYCLRGFCILPTDSTVVTKTALQEIDAHALMGMWYRIVADYSSRHLTKGQDRFTAISGVARIIAERVRSEYCAGLWASEFVYGLLWKSSYPITKILKWRTEHDYNSVSQ
ncbi:hypothetical protein COCSADRAFT_49781, partial [Bipolaris sorokiniana ND90Pr]